MELYGAQGSGGRIGLVNLAGSGGVPVRDSVGAQGAARTAADAWRAAIRMGSQTGENGGA